MASKNKKKLNRTQKKVEQIKEDLNIKDAEILTKEDYDAIAYQCEKYRDACAVGTVGSCIAKFAVYYKKQWFFVTYNRDKQKIGSAFDITFLDAEEHAAFLRFKGRIEADIRRRIMEKAPELQPAVKIQNANVPDEE